MKILLFSAFLLLSTAVFAETPDKAPTETAEFTGEQLKIKKRIEELFDASKKVNSKEKAKARAEIEGGLDWDKVAQVCVGPATAKKQPAEKMSEFKRLLREVISKTAYTRLDKFWADGTTYKLAKIDIKGPEAVVLSQFNVNGQAFALEYYLVKKSANWLVWDISYENERYSVNINEQIEGFLREKGFTDLLGKLRKRLEDLSDTKSKKS